MHTRSGNELLVQTIPIDVVSLGFTPKPNRFVEIGNGDYIGAGDTNQYHAVSKWVDDNEQTMAIITAGEAYVEVDSGSGNIVAGSHVFPTTDGKANSTGAVNSQKGVCMETCIITGATVPQYVKIQIIRN